MIITNYAFYLAITDIYHNIYNRFLYQLIHENNFQDILVQMQS